VATATGEPKALTAPVVAQKPSSTATFCPEEAETGALTASGCLHPNIPSSIIHNPITNTAPIAPPFPSNLIIILLFIYANATLTQAADRENNKGAVVSTLRDNASLNGNMILVKYTPNNIANSPNRKLIYQYRQQKQHSTCRVIDTPQQIHNNLPHGYAVRVFVRLFSSTYLHYTPIIQITQVLSQQVQEMDDLKRDMTGSHLSQL
jgi:hypothetical protein